MTEFDLYPNTIGGTVVQVLVSVFDASSRALSTQVATDLRNNGIRTELYLEDRKLDKQIKYADKKGIPLIIIAGPDEIANQQVKLRRLADGTERMAGFDGVVATVRDLLAL